MVKNLRWKARPAFLDVSQLGKAMTKVYAFHGDGARPSHLREDMGNPSWVSDYVDWKRQDTVEVAYDLSMQEAVVLVGYSSGGGFIADILSHLLDNIAGAILYESPVGQPFPPGGDFPALLLWNQGSWRATSRKADKARKAWRMGGRKVVEPSPENWGSGGHSRWIRRPRTLCRAHNWDQSLSAMVERWISGLQTS